MVEEESPETVHERLEAGENVQVIDIRPERSYEQGHIPGATNIPLDRFAAEIDRHEWSDDIVVACPIGESSRQAARLLESYEGVPENARVANMTGGYDAWEYDLETGVERDGSDGDGDSDGDDAEELEKAGDVDAPF